MRNRGEASRIIALALAAAVGVLAHSSARSGRAAVHASPARGRLARGAGRGPADGAARRRARPGPVARHVRRAGEADDAAGERLGRLATAQLEHRRLGARGRDRPEGAVGLPADDALRRRPARLHGPLPLAVHRAGGLVGRRLELRRAGAALPLPRREGAVRPGDRGRPGHRRRLRGHAQRRPPQRLLDRRSRSRPTTGGRGRRRSTSTATSPGRTSRRSRPARRARTSTSRGTVPRAATSTSASRTTTAPPGRSRSSATPSATTTPTTGGCSPTALSSSPRAAWSTRAPRTCRARSGTTP